MSDRDARAARRNLLREAEHEEDNAEEVFYQTYDLLVDQRQHVQVVEDHQHLVHLDRHEGWYAEAEEAVAAIDWAALPEAIAVIDEAIAAMDEGRRARGRRARGRRVRVIRLNNQLAVGPRW